MRICICQDLYGRTDGGCSPFRGRQEPEIDCIIASRCWIQGERLAKLTKLYQCQQMGGQIRPIPHFRLVVAPYVLQILLAI